MQQLFHNFNYCVPDLRVILNLRYDCNEKISNIAVVLNDIYKQIESILLLLSMDLKNVIKTGIP